MTPTSKTKTLPSHSHSGADPNRAIQAIKDAFASTPAAIETDTAQLDTRFKRLYQKIIIGVGILLLIFLVAFGYIFNKVGALGTQVSDQSASLKRSQEILSGFQAQLDSANLLLQAKGLPQILGPTGGIPIPGSPDDVRLRLAAGTASTLALLPPQTLCPLGGTYKHNAVTGTYGCVDGPADPPTPGSDSPGSPPAIKLPPLGDKPVPDPSKSSPRPSERPTPTHSDAPHPGRSAPHPSLSEKPTSSHAPRPHLGERIPHSSSTTPTPAPQN